MELGRRVCKANTSCSFLRTTGKGDRLKAIQIQAVTVKYSARQYSTFGRSVYISLLSDGIEIIVILFCWRTFGFRTKVAITTLLVDKPEVLPPLVELMW